MSDSEPGAVRVEGNGPAVFAGRLVTQHFRFRAIEFPNAQPTRQRFIDTGMSISKKPAVGA
jgi:hypothetical protein